MMEMVSKMNVEKCVYVWTGLKCVLEICIINSELKAC